jgi:hypothetical protein
LSGGIEAVRGGARRDEVFEDEADGGGEELREDGEDDGLFEETGLAVSGVEVVVFESWLEKEYIFSW